MPAGPATRGCAMANWPTDRRNTMKHGRTGTMTLGMAAVLCAVVSGASMAQGGSGSANGTISSGVSVQKDQGSGNNGSGSSNGSTGGSSYNNNNNSGNANSGSGSQNYTGSG